EEQHGHVQPALAAQVRRREVGGGRRRGHDQISRRRISDRIRMDTAASTGSRNSAVAAPRPSAPPCTPVKKASDGSTCVALAGPPRVRMNTVMMSENTKTKVNRMVTPKTGISIGRMTWNRRRK